MSTGSSIYCSALLLIAAMATNPAFASCSLPGAALPYISYAGGNPGTLTVNPAAANGQILYTWAQRLETGPSFRCTSWINYLEYRGAGVLGAHQAYSTNVPGVGVRMRYNSTHAQVWPTSIRILNSVWPVSGNVFQVDLIKTGTISSPGTINGEIGYSSVPSHGSKPLSLQWANPIRIEPAIPTCAVENTTQEPVLLGDYSALQYPTVGSTSPKVRLDIRLRCFGGGPGGRRNIYTTLTDSSAPGNRSDLLTLAADSTAQGLAIRITRNDGATVRYGPRSTSVGNVNQWLAGAVVTGQSSFVIPLWAQAVRTSRDLVPGSVKGFLTFTMAYN